MERKVLGQTMEALSFFDNAVTTREKIDTDFWIKR